MKIEKELSKGLEGLWLPKEVLSYTNLKPSELLVLSMIINLDNENGCTATNKYISNIINISPGQISVIINRLKEKEHITAIYTKETGNKRVLIYNNKDVKETTTPIKETTIPITKTTIPIMETVIPSNENKDHYNKDYNKEDNNIIYYKTEKEFLEDWSKVRKTIQGKETNIITLNTEKKKNFNKAINIYSREYFRDAMIGFFRQKNMFETIKIRPTMNLLPSMTRHWP